MNDKHCATRRIRASSRIKALGWNRATHNPHGFARAARGHAWLGYAGGSRRSPQPIDGGDPEPAGISHRKPFARDFGNGGNGDGRNDAHHDRHVPARLLDMVGKRPVIIIDGMTVDSAIGMSVGDDVTVSAVGVIEGKAEIVVAGVSGRGF